MRVLSKKFSVRSYADHGIAVPMDCVLRWTGISDVGFRSIGALCRLRDGELVRIEDYPLFRFMKTGELSTMEESKTGHPYDIASTTADVLSLIESLKRDSCDSARNIVVVAMHDYQIVDGNHWVVDSLAMHGAEYRIKVLKMWKSDRRPWNPCVCGLRSRKDGFCHEQ